MDKEIFSRLYSRVIPFASLGLCFRKQKIREGYHVKFALMTENSTEDNKSFDR